MRSRLSSAVAAGAILGALAVPAGGHAHGIHGARDGYVATFSSLKPHVLGVLVNVYGPKNLFRLTNYSGKTVILRGARGEAYLRFTPSGVYENALAPTTYANASRPVPGEASPDAAPRWRRVASGTSYTWHEHRIVWSDDDPPEVVRENPHESHLVFNWSIPASLDGKPFRIEGFLGWAPPAETAGDGGPNGLLIGAAIAGGAVVALAAIVATLWRRARRPA